MPVKNPSKEVKRRWNLAARYKISPQEADSMLERQGGLCAICSTPPKRRVIDHDHATGKVRGILCHGCNIKLPAIEDRAWIRSAEVYLFGPPGAER